MRVVILTVVLAAVLNADARKLIGNQRSICTGVEDGEYLANDASCSDFFICYDGDPIPQSCGYLSYYDEPSSACLPDPENTICPQKQCTNEGAFSEYPGSCYLFYVCNEGKLVEQKCSVGSYFDKVNLYCVPDEENTCIQPQCNQEGVFSEKPGSCNQFYVCSGSQLIEQACGTGSYFDKDTLACIPDTENVCPQVQCTDSGKYSAHPTNCNLFYVCYEGQLVEQSCGVDSYFDKLNGYCVPDTDNTCPQTPCSEDGEFFPHPTECALFYVCYSGQFVEQTCGENSYFDKDNKYCVPDTEEICWSSTTTPGPTPTPCTCVGGYSEGDFVASPDNCYSYYICSDGELVEQNCGYGNYFDSATKRCDRDTTGKCWTDVDSTTTTTTGAPCTCTGGYNEGDLIPSSDNCYSYFICSQGELVEQSCGTGNYFDSTSKTCERDELGVCWPTESPPAPCKCPGGYEEGDLVSNPDNCHSYFVCSQGELVVHSCGTGNYYDSNKKECFRDDNGICWPTEPPAPCKCPGGYEEGDFVANTNNCYSYFICTQGELVEQNCGTGNYYDSNSKTCVRDDNGICWPTEPPAPCNCPGGYEEGDFVPNSDNCYSYFICTQGKLVEQNCGTGNYYDSNSKTCARDDSGICWPTEPPAPCKCPGGYEEGDFVANSNNCYSYFICTQGELVEQNCGTGNYYDSNSKTCARDDSGICWPTEPPAPCKCPGGYEEGDLVSNPDNCHSYFVCSQGELVVHSCGTGNYYDSKKKECVRDDNGICWPTEPPAPCKCPGDYEEGDFVANSNNCSSYFICTQGELVEQNCGTGNYYDSKSKTCARDVSGVCWPTTPAPCTCAGGYNEGDLIPFPGNCYLFYICFKGELVEESCGTGNYFNATTTSCVVDTTGICWTTTSSTTTTTEAPGSCPGGYENGALAPDPESCSKFYICSNGEFVAHFCEYGSYYNATTESCIEDKTGVCWSLNTTSTTTVKSSSTSSSTSTSTTQAPCTCSDGSKDGDFVPYPESCYQYYLCHDGELLVQSCQNGSYFDDESNTCVVDIYGVCWDKTSSTSSSTLTTASSTTGSTNTPSTSTLPTTKTSTTPSSTSTSTTQAPSCPGGSKEGEMVAYPGSCSQYYLCYNGELVEKSCQTGSYFDSESKGCVLDNEGICWKTTSSSSSSSSSTTGSTNTPSTTTESTTKTSTTPSSTSTSSTQAPSCPGGSEEGEMVAYPGSCSQYYLCYNGELVEKSCQAGNYFDSESKGCVLDTEGICWKTTSSSSSSTTGSTNTPSTTTESTTKTSTTLSSTSTSTTQAPNCPGGSEEGEMVAYPGSCSQYYLCYNGELVEKSCQTGSYFDSESKGCVLDTEGICWKTTSSSSSSSSSTTGSTNTPSTTTESTTKTSTTPSSTSTSTTQAPTTCPDGSKDGDLVPYPGSCYMFYSCQKGELVVQSCGYGNYFDSESKTCIYDTTGVCWPLSTSTSTSTETSSSTATPSSSTTTGSTPTISTSTASTVVPCECPGGYVDGEFIPNPTDCSTFYVCYQGDFVEVPCGVGNYFNSTTKRCEVDSTGVCWATTTSTTKSSTTPSTPSSTTPSSTTPSSTTPSSTTPSSTTPSSTTPSSTTPSSTTPSSTTPSSTTPSSTTPSSTTPSSTTPSSTTPSSTTPSSTTPSSTTPSSTDSTAKSTTTSTTTPAPCKCLGEYDDGEFVQNPNSCYLFFVCYQGELVEVSCGFGNYFDNKTRTCVLDTDGVCWGTSTSTTTTISTPAPAPCTCPGGYENGDFVPHPDSCYLFYVCYQGELSPLSCGVGNYFDKASNSCVSDTTGVCWTTPTPAPCECPNGLQEGQLVANTESCSRYYICTGGVLLEGSCGYGNYFNNESRICEPDTGGCCWSNQPPTPPVPTPCECPNGMKEGELIANPTACSLYYVCSNGQLVEGNCGTYNYFNNDTNLCEPDTGGCCWPNRPPTPPAPSPCECPNGMKEGQLIANPSACSLYYVCSNGELVEGNCGTYNYFNNDTNLCEPDTGGCCWPNKPPTPPAPSPCECPNGLKEGQFIANPSACSMYYICSNGELVEGNCGTYNYFNNNTNLCEPDTGGCCWPNRPPPAPEPTPCDCPNGLTEGQFIANPNGCYLYYVCTGGALVEGNCGSGNYFNKNTNLCEPDAGGCCWPGSHNGSCAGGYKNGDFIPDPAQCDKFLICYDGQLVEQDCGVGYVFDVDNNYCTRDTNGTCWTVQTSNNTCVGMADGTFLPNDAACDKFFVCYNNTKISQDCGVGNVFNSGSLSCSRDTVGSCWTKIPNVCANKEPGTFVASPSNCQEFYMCYQNRAVLQQCDNTNWFNPTLMICQPDFEGTCINVCQGFNNSVQLPHPNCNQFYICADGRTTGVGTCPSGTNFDVTLGVCKASAVCEANICYKSTNGAVFPVLNDLTSFYSCRNQVAVKLSCPDGTSFDPDRLVCMPDTGRCIGQKNGYTVASYNNPNAYYVCRNNMAIFEQCPSYAIFDETKGVCVHAQRKRLVGNICASELDGTMLPGDACNTYHLCLDGESIEQNCGAYSSFNPKLGYCTFNLSCFDQEEMCAKSSDIEKFPDARFENSFVKCKRGVSEIEKCPKHTIYSHDIGYCVPHEMVMTIDELDELCDKMPDNTMAPALDCRKFYICRNSVAILQQCAIDQYFDTKTASCRADVERQCWMRSETLRRSLFLRTVNLDNAYEVIA